MVNVRLFLFILLVGAGLIYFYLYLNSPSSNELCVVCHSMKPFKASIERTEHGKFNCHVCHPFNSRALRDVVIYLYENPSAEEIKKRANVNLFFQCLYCHKVSSELHSEHNEKLIPCNKCHYIHEKRNVKESCSSCHERSIVKIVENGDFDVEID